MEQDTPGDLDRNVQLHGIARDIASQYGGAPGVRAVLLGGSVSRGWADRWSDIELVVCWETMPSPGARTELAASLGALGRRVHPADGELRSHEEELVYDGEKIDLAHVGIDGVAAILNEVTVGCDPSLRKHAMVAGIRDAIGLAGNELLGRWQRQAAVYPDPLRQRMIERNLVFGPHWWPEMLAERNDLLPLHDILVRIGRTLLGIVAALNRTYLPSDSFKWSQRVASRMPIAPNQFGPRLVRIFRMPPVEAVREAGILIEEVFGLVAEHAPEAPVDTALARFASPRAARAGSQEAGEAAGQQRAAASG